MLLFLDSNILSQSLITLQFLVNRAGWNVAQRLGVLGPILKMRSSLSIRSSVLCYNQLILLVIDCARLKRRFAVPALVTVCKCCNPSDFALRLTDLRVLVTDKCTMVWDDHRILTESFGPKLADAGNPLVRQLGRHLSQPRADWSHPRATKRNGIQ
jgi:hypothetical protein